MLKLKNRNLSLTIIPLLLALLLLGCNLTERLGLRTAAEPTPTRTPLPTYTPTPINAAFESAPIAPSSPQPEQPQSPPPTPTQSIPTPPPADTPTPTPSAPVVTLIQNMNVRSGPGTGYPIAGAGPVGETATVIGRNNDSTWLQVEYPAGNDGTGWLFAELVQLTGSVDAVPVIAVAPPPPPTAAPPTPVPTEAPVAEAPPPEPEKKYQFTPTGWSATQNAAIVHFKGRIRDESGNLVNGFSVLVDNGSFSVLAHPTGPSRHYPGKGDGEWDVVMPNIYQAQGWWWLTVVSYDCPNFEGAFDAQCKQFTRLSEDVKIEVRTPEESVINADWTCHWDCDKGLYVQGYRQP